MSNKIIIAIVIILIILIISIIIFIIYISSKSTSSGSSKEAYYTASTPTYSSSGSTTTPSRYWSCTQVGNGNAIISSKGPNGSIYCIGPNGKSCYRYSNLSSCGKVINSTVNQANSGQLKIYNCPARLIFL